MMTWTYCDEHINAVVTADDIDLAIELLEDELRCKNVVPLPIIENTDLVPLPTHHRHCRLLYKAER